MNLSNAELERISIHFVGNKSYSTAPILSAGELGLDTKIRGYLQDYFLSKFINSVENYTFSHPSSLQYNEVYNYAKDIFSSTGSFHNHSKAIANHLYESSSHPKVKPGELYICYFKNCLYEEQNVNAIGIFKSENKYPFLEVDQNGNEFKIYSREGIDKSKLDKGCLIFNINSKDGFIVNIVDTQNAGSEAQYWKDTFLTVRARNDNYHSTNNFLKLTKEYITSTLPSENSAVTKAEQVDLLNKSVRYFKENETFNVQDFQNHVFDSETLIESFRNFGAAYLENSDIAIGDSFPISNAAVKKMARTFKSVLKLDNNFHIYVHGNKELIEKGFDEEKNMNYYKVYFRSEQ